MRLLAFDRYPESVNYPEHLLIKFQGTSLEFRYLRRYFNRLPVETKDVHAPGRQRVAALQNLFVIYTQLNDTIYSFAFRVFASEERMSWPDFKEHRDNLMLLKLGTE